MEAEAYKALAIALGLGLLVGLQREWDEEHGQAGIRTFALITLLGAIAALLARSYGGWVVAAGVVAVAGLLITGNWVLHREKAEAEEGAAGQTTEAAALVMYGVGALLVTGYTMPAVVLGGATAVLLHSKSWLQRFIGGMSDSDARAIFQFALIALVILPLVPNRAYGPYAVLNPFKIWLMVVLIVGISLVAYVAFRIVGARVGAVLGGVFGGFISSTATTVSYARQCRGNPAAVGAASLVLVIASTVVLVRVAIEIAAVARGLLPAMMLPFGILFVLMTAISAGLYWRLHHSKADAPVHGNPSQLKAAIVFGALYAAVLLLVAFVSDRFGGRAIYVAAFVSGLTDVDALTLSVAELYNQERVPRDTAWRAIMFATLSNLAFKAGAAGMLGGMRLFRVVAPAFGATIAVGLVVILLWP